MDPYKWEAPVRANREKALPSRVLTFAIRSGLAIQRQGDLLELRLQNRTDDGREAETSKTGQRLPS